MQDCPELRGKKACAVRDSRKSRNESKLRWFGALRWPFMRLAKAKKRGETKMIRCLEIALCQTRECREARRNWFNALRWPFISLTKAERRRSSSLRDSYLAPECTSQPSSTLSLILPQRTFRVIKGKEKKQIIFLYITVTFLCIQQYHITVYKKHLRKNYTVIWI